MIQIYLLVNSLLYLILSIWCFIKPIGTAKYLGYTFLNNNGKIEYITVYAGLEIGIAVFLAIAGFSPSIKISGLIFCVCIYVGSMIIRTGGALFYGNISKETYMMGSLEYVLGILGLILLFKNIKTN